MVIGLTGGIGSGKSTVLNMFKDLGVITYIADIEAKKLMNTDPILISEIKSLLGYQAYSENVLNSSFVGKMVFNDSGKLAQLNALVHPRVKAHFNKFIDSRSNDLVIYEAAILFESGSHKQCDYVISVIADLATRIERVRQRDSLSKEEVLERIRNQSSDEYKIKRSDFIIHNNQFKQTEEQVKSAFQLLQKIQNK